MNPKRELIAWAAILYAVNSVVGCQKEKPVEPVVQVPIMVTIGDTNDWSLKLDWAGYTNLCLRWLWVGHVAASRGYELDVAASNAVVALEKSK